MNKSHTYKGGNTMDIKVLKVEPGKNPEETFLSTDIRSIQEAVSIGAPGRCFFQTVYLEKNVVLLCNDAGKLIGLEGNRRIGRDIIAGVFYITECDSDGNLMSISDKNLLFYKIIFWKPEKFTPEEMEESKKPILISIR